jgi:hypothetical protein
MLAPAPVRAQSIGPGAIASEPMRLGEKVADYRARVLVADRPTCDATSAL